MSLETIATIGHWSLVAMLISVILFDLRYMRLPNTLAMLFVVVFVLTVSWSLPIAELATRVGIAVIVLVIGIAANAAKLLGGGDVKILSALMLFVPRGELLAFAFILCISMIIGIAALLALRRAMRAHSTVWRGLQTSGRYPMGISIGVAGLILALRP